MRACIQRVSQARVLVASGSLAADGAGEGSAPAEVAGAIGRGLLVLLGVGREDTLADAQQLADKIVALRIFEDEQGKMNRSLLEAGGSLLVVSQFTLWGDCRKGRRPSFVEAAPPEQAEGLYLAFIAAAGAQGARVATGRFRASMQVELTNDGPVTLLLDSRRLF